MDGFPNFVYNDFMIIGTLWMLVLLILDTQRDKSSKNLDTLKK